MGMERTATASSGNQLLKAMAAAGVVCPVCHGALAAIPQGGVCCGGCGRMYPARDGLPVLIAAEATLL